MKSSNGRERRGTGEIADALRGVRDIPGQMRNIWRPMFADVPMWIGIFLGVTALGLAGPAPSHPTTRHLIGAVIGYGLWFLVSFRIIVQGPHRWAFLFSLTLCAIAISGVTYELSRSTATSGWRIAIIVLVLCCFVLPLFGLALLWPRVQDELQRSLVAGGAVVAMVTVVLGSIGYWLLGRVIALPALSALWVAGAAAAVWALAWYGLRRRIS